MKSSLLPLTAAAVLGTTLFAPLAHADTAMAVASRLDTVVANKKLTVCTTGDYKPNTYLNPETNAFEGIDIDLAKHLGKSLGAEVSFVKTSWPTLMKDYAAGMCDIAVGGISVTLDRARQAFYSAPLARSGKTPITRCENVAKFQTLEQIDQPDVTAIVNPGGTNERFARASLKQAKIEVYNDNVTIFDQILQGKADLMMTDAEETLLQQKLRPGLCAVHPEAPFTFSEKAFLLPRGDEVFKHYVDQWAHLSREDGSLQKIVKTWLP
ncbi:transporter substrate-binding domain-containing protein [Denitromonas iodatirespirans]|uniref:Transporter substrate-binding domain-containing protein n=1 Tax=Denitromonas iodatirespirans TaxID=2795389 RepID=A0A944DCG8_DENI1|nr:transporter substrate-binding domain-containing protein [Denitromonas iodatirespirans]MBT0962511.1 transporter substrate-binding domain-containing protein [Denitromonas iodatirespirans]